MEEEGAVIVGMLVGLNVIDANLCVKGEDLDSQVKHIAIQTMLSDDTDAKHCVFVSAGGRHWLLNVSKGSASYWEHTGVSVWSLSKD